MSNSSAPSNVRWRILALLLAFSFMSWFNRVSMPVAYNVRIQGQLDISKEQIGYVYSVLLFSYMIFMTPGGWFADRWGTRLSLALMGLGSGVFVFLTGMVGLVATSAAAVLSLLLMARMLMGVFTAPIYPSSTRVIAEWMPAGQRAGATGAVMAAALLGNASTYFAFGALLDEFDWPAAFMVTGTITVLLAFLWTWYGRSRPKEHPAVSQEELATVGENPLLREQAEEANPWDDVLHNRSLVFLTVSYAAVGYFEYLFYFWMQSYFKDELNVSESDSRLYSTIISLATAAGMLLGGWLTDRIARARGQRFACTLVVVSGLLAAAALLGVGVKLRDPGSIVFCFALANAAVGLTEGPSWTTAIRLGGRRAATAAGIFNTGGNAGGMLAPVVTPLIGENFGWNWAITLGGVVCVVGAVLWFWIDPTEAER